jgi:hypothetical protein
LIFDKFHHGIRVAFIQLARAKGGLNMQSDHFIQVMALLNAIVRCFSDNIGKIDMNRLAQPLFAGQAIPAVTMSTIEAEKP